MKIESKKLIRQMRKLPDAQRGHLIKAIAKSTEEGASVTRVLAPDVTGETRDNITTQYRSGGMVGEVVVIDSGAPSDEKDRAYSIEHGRKEGDHGTTEGNHHVHRTRQYLGKRFKGRIRRAINKAAKEVARG
ncbi:hypothetical protein DL239_20180 [Sedimentitalea sp. CY04]|uniref:HK97 gp10 family phage protein n=1 Tax=Parasedimentitalea denitrificans TaxID=2211118 RepID=A0ABX0WES6_9RHOB|nr:hypothetical protein [Sedimentitalea sp. CY04]NIZ63289.1 hypothetical protein [Sedimentitalea sp. CY04]